MPTSERRKLLYPRRSLELTRSEWEALDKLAAELGSLSVSKRNPGKTTWRTLIKEITNGTIICTRKETEQ